MKKSTKIEQKKQDQPTGEGDGRYQLALKAVRALEDAGFQARLAGGCVRDRLLGIRPKDYDIATSALPEQTCTVFKQKNIKTVPTGIEHGTITVVMAGQGVEVTSLRRDVATDGRRATVAFTRSFEEDAERRDFSFNAMYEDAQGQVYDYFNGREDLKNGRLRFVGQAQDRIREDYLRILRMFRFWSRFGFSPEAETLQACAAEKQGLLQVSQERITAELVETLQGDCVAPVLEAMDSTGILELVLGISRLPKPLLDRVDALKIGKKEERSVARLGLLLQLKLGDEPKAMEEALKNLRLSRNFQQKVLLSIFVPLSRLDPEPGQLLEHIDLWEAQHGDSFLDTLLPLWRVMYPEHKALLDTIEAVEARYGFRRRAKCPLDGQTLMARLGLKPGPELGLILQDLKRRWRLGEWQSLDEGLERAKILLQDKNS